MTEFGGRWGESWLSHRRVLNHEGVGGGRVGVGVGQTLSTDWCHRSDPRRSGRRRGGGTLRDGSVKGWGGRGGWCPWKRRCVRYYWVGENLHYCQLGGFRFLAVTKEETRANIFFSSILTCDFSVPECINSRRLFNY